MGPFLDPKTLEDASWSSLSLSSLHLNTSKTLGIGFWNCHLLWKFLIYNYNMFFGSIEVILLYFIVFVYETEKFEKV